MKIYIKASTSKSLTLAKGIFIQKYDMPSNIANNYKDMLVENKYINGFLFISEAEYDTTTGQLSNNIINHDQLITKYNLNSVSDTVMTYFRIDLNNNKTGTELTTSGKHNYKLNEYLCDLFSMTSDIDTSFDDWISIDDPDYVSLFNRAAARCSKYIAQLKSNNITDLSDYSQPDYFAFCFAIIDPETESALISDSTDGILFASPSYSLYLKQTSQIAKSLGKNSRNDLSFKSLYYADGYDNMKGPGTIISLGSQSYNLLKYLASRYRNEIKIKNAREYWFSFNKNKQVWIDVNPKYPKIDIVSVSNSPAGIGRVFTLQVPQDTVIDDITADKIYKMLQKI